MTTQPSIEHFTLLKDVLGCLVSCPVLTMIHTFTNACAEEAFDTGLLPTDPPSRHAAGHAVRGELLLVRGGGILAPPIRVLQQRRLREIPREPRPYRLAPHRARVKVENHCQRES